MVRRCSHGSSTQTLMTAPHFCAPSQSSTAAPGLASRTGWPVSGHGGHTQSRHVLLLSETFSMIRMDGGPSDHLAHQPVESSVPDDTGMPDAADHVMLGPFEQARP